MQLSLARHSLGIIKSAFSSESRKCFIKHSYVEYNIYITYLYYNKQSSEGKWKTLNDLEELLSV